MRKAAVDGSEEGEKVRDIERKIQRSKQEEKKIKTFIRRQK